MDKLLHSGLIESPGAFGISQLFHGFPRFFQPLFDDPIILFSGSICPRCFKTYTDRCALQSPQLLFAQPSCSLQHGEFSPDHTRTAHAWCLKKIWSRFSFFFIMLWANIKHQLWINICPVILCTATVNFKLNSQRAEIVPVVTKTRTGHWHSWWSAQPWQRILHCQKVVQWCPARTGHLFFGRLKKRWVKMWSLIIWVRFKKGKLVRSGWKRTTMFIIWKTLKIYN